MGLRPGNCPGAIYRIRGIIEAMPLGHKIVEVGKVTEPRPGDRPLGPKSVEIGKVTELLLPLLKIAIHRIPEITRGRQPQNTLAANRRHAPIKRRIGVQPSDGHVLVGGRSEPIMEAGAEAGGLRRRKRQSAANREVRRRALWIQAFLGSESEWDAQKRGRERMRGVRFGDGGAAFAPYGFKPRECFRR